MIDFDKSNQQIQFVSDLKQIKGSVNLETNHTDSEMLKEIGGNKDQKQAFINEIKEVQSENKKQYKKLADAIVKEEQLKKISQALTLDK